ncbi:MAG: ribosome silencing factor [Planctomycetota bacterium]
MTTTPDEFTTRSVPAETDDDSDPAVAPGRPSKDLEAARAFAVEAARLVSDLRCEDILVFDVTGMSQVTNFIVIATGTSDRQIKSVGGDVADLGQEHGFERYGTDRDGASTWCIVDLVEVMVHLFEPATRGHYDLEMMWGDAPQVKWRRV